ncbi:MAG: branched-chain amino acid transport system II carrier protein, partial [Clostridia bacterium]|nr:branched-chain amino acid transport system II carrier protein [Clostridia bacterium]
VIDIIRAMGITDDSAVAKDVLLSGILTGVLMAGIYIATILMGAQSRGLFEISENGGIALAQISGPYLGAAGSVVLAHYDGDDKPDSYVGIFENQRAMFGQSEVAKAGRLRDKDFEFGLLPKPKYDEAQERYYSIQSYPASGVSIPVTSTNPVKAAKLSDALNYIFKEDVYPIFRELTLEQKHLRDEESVEMLDILIESAVPNYSTIFSLDTSGFYTNLATQLRSGNSSVASVVASNENALKAAVDKVNTVE